MLCTSVSLRVLSAPATHTDRPVVIGRYTIRKGLRRNKCNFLWCCRGVAQLDGHSGIAVVVGWNCDERELGRVCPSRMPAVDLRRFWAYDEGDLLSKHYPLIDLYLDSGSIGRETNRPCDSCASPVKL